MEKFQIIIGTAVYLPITNIDTDMIIPKQFLKTIKRSGLGQWLFAAMRYDGNGHPIKDFALNQNPQAQILLAGENFGCGSSREHAPWSLHDFGIRVIMAPSFADIFYNNCFKNRLLPIKLPQQAITDLAQNHSPIQINLETQEVISGNLRFSFEIEANHKNVLLNGLDDIETVMQMQKDIKGFEERHFAQQSWLK